MTETSIDLPCDDTPVDVAVPVSYPPHSDYPDIPHPIYRPARGSPYFIDPDYGTKARLFPPGTPPMTSEDVRKALEDFP